MGEAAFALPDFIDRKAHDMRGDGCEEKGLSAGQGLEGSTSPLSFVNR